MATLVPQAAGQVDLPDAPPESAAAASFDAAGFRRAVPGRPIVLPRDHGAHLDTRTEWWYLTGPLQTEDGRRFGFQATWFRRGMVREVAGDRSPLAVRDVYLFHGVLVDVAREEQHVTEQASRGYGPWAGAAPDRLAVRLLGHELVDPVGDGATATLHFRAGDAELSLQLDLAASPVLRHGREPGLSVKGHQPGEASWYYTLPRIGVRGEIELPDDGVVDVSGTAWFDHEFGSGQLGDGQVGWDWFSVPLDDGSELMVYVLRRDDGTPDTTSAGTLRRPDGSVVHLDHEAFTVQATGSWRSERSGAEYPSGWVVTVPGERLRLEVTPLVEDQEIDTPRTTGVTYWEGLCVFAGERDGSPVTGHGYVELVGYTAPIGDRWGRPETGEPVGR